MFLTCKYIFFIQKYLFCGFLKNIKTGEFCKTRNFLKKKHGICKINFFMQRGIFEKNTEFSWGILDEL